MPRIDRRNREQEYTRTGGVYGLFDQMLMETYRLTNDEYDTLCELLTDGEMGCILTENPTFLEKREILRILNKYI